MADHFAEKDGHQLVADMLREVHGEWLGNKEFQQSENGAGWPLLKGDVLRRYLATVKDSNSPTLEQGFLSALTDFIGSCCDGGVPDPEYYEEEAV